MLLFRNADHHFCGISQVCPAGIQHRRRQMELAKNEFNIQLADRNGLKTGSLVVAGSNYLSSDLLPIIISSFRAKHPGVDITLSEANSTHLREMLATEDIDIAIDNFEGDKDVCTAFPIMEEQIMLWRYAQKPLHPCC